jgi:hypothetical protein
MMDERLENDQLNVVRIGEEHTNGITPKKYVVIACTLPT